MAQQNKQLAQWKKYDPNYAKEKEKYGMAVPSRAFIMDALEAADEPISFMDMADAMHIQDDQEREAFKKRVRAMVRDGDILRNRHGDLLLIDRIGVVVGQVQAYKDGSGVVVDEKAGEEIMLPPRDMRQVLHGDRVVVHTHYDPNKDRMEGKLIEVVERADWLVVGRFKTEAGVGWISPDNPFLFQQVMVGKSKLKPKPGDWVTAEMIEPPSKESPPVAKIKKILNAEDRPGLETEVAILAHGLPHQFNKEVREELKVWGKTVRRQDKADRVDLRELPLVTIDGADAKDFDDAVYCERVKVAGKPGFRLIVAIADVSHYVAHGTALDTEAQDRGTSVYFPRKVIPMLPEVLSNGLCSLNPNVDRLCMACDMRVNHLGEVTQAKFYEGLMKSHQRFTYTQVADLLSDKARPSLKRKFADRLPELQALQDLYELFAKQRAQRGAMDFDFPQLHFVFNKEGYVEGIESSERNIAHKLIEECMIATNVQAARFLERHNIPALYRAHEDPSEAKIEELRPFLAIHNIKLPKVKRLTPKHLMKVLEQARGHREEETIQTAVLRSMMQADYRSENIGHFGLALEDYAHFTSPIRRYPDLLVHRAIRHMVRHKKAKGYDYSAQAMASLGRQCSKTERRAEDATRDAVKWLQCEFMKPHVGKVFAGTISRVKNFGLFVRLDDNGIVGMLHVSDLGQDYFVFDEQSETFKGRRSGRRFALGDAISIRVENVDMDKRFIDFALADAVKKQRSNKRSAKPNKNKKSNRSNKPNKNNKPTKANKNKKPPSQSDKPKKKRSQRRKRKK